VLVSCRTLPAELRPQQLKGLAQFSIGQRISVALCHHHQIEAVQEGAVATEAFAHQALDAVAVYGAAELLAGNGKSKPRRLIAIGSGQDGETSIVYAARPLEDLSELTGLQQSGGAWKPLAQGKQSKKDDLLRGQAGTALGTAGLDDLATIRSSHAGTEAMVAGALQAAGLKSAFHDGDPELSVSGQTSRRTKNSRPAERGGKVIDWRPAVNQSAVKHPRQ
jgi:hypothetical protein